MNKQLPIAVTDQIVRQQEQIELLKTLTQNLARVAGKWVDLHNRSTVLSQETQMYLDEWEQFKSKGS